MESETQFSLPDNILAALPTDPYEQLDVARKITSMAIASRVSKLELENGRLRVSIGEKDRLIAELQEKLGHLDRMFQQADARLQNAIDENANITKERDSLAATSKKLARDVAKLETFKKQLMQSLSEDQPSPNPAISSSYLQKQEDAVEIRTYGQSITQGSSLKDELSIAHSSSYSTTTSAESENKTKDVTRLAVQKFSKTPPIPRRLTPPTATPKKTSTAGSPKRFSTTVSPKYASGATSPTKTSYDGLTSMSPWFPSSKQSSAANSPPRGRNLPGRTPRVDGKEFFRQARSRLSYEQFGAFLANIKELNAHKQSREETLKKAEEIFGPDNRDLYLSFQGLLMRNMP